MTPEYQNQIENAKEYYEILRMRQGQIISIIKETTQMVAKIESQHRFAGKGSLVNQQVEKNFDGGLRLAFSLINALANILDEQMKALNVFERLIMEDKTSIQPHHETEYDYQVYYEVTSKTSN